MSLFSELKRRNVFRVGLAYSVTAWLVAQVAELAFDSFGAPPWVMKTLIFLLAVGLVFALIFAWAYELTPEGLKLEKDVDRSASITQKTGRKLNYTIIGILAVALAFSVVTHRWTTGDEAPSHQDPAAMDIDRSIAVLPFVNMSDDPSNEYFSDGLSEELLNVLVKVEGLRVASRTSSFSFKGKDTPIPEIAEALKVAHVLEGSVRKAGNTVRVTAQLIDVKTDSHLWSETYDRKLEDIFAIQDEISAHIVEALRVALAADQQNVTHEHPTEDLDAYEDYLRGRHLWQKRGADNIREAIELFTRAASKDPGFARAWSSLGAAHLTMPVYANSPYEEHHAKALQFSQRALELDPALSEPHAVIADLLRFSRRWSEAEKHYLRAIELEPRNSTGYLWYTEQLGATGRVDQSLDVILKALELDPFNTGVNSQASYVYAITGNDEQALKYLEIARDMGHPNAIYIMIDYQVDLGEFDEARRLVAENAALLGQDEVEGYQRLIAAAEDPAKVDDYLAYEAQYFDEPPFWYALDAARLDRVDRGVQLLLEMDLDGGEWMTLWLPGTQQIRQHERFGELVRAAGLDDFWDEVGWPAQCQRAGETITCD